MTTEEKAKAYDKALERAKRIHQFSSDLAEIKRMEDIFPELAESEDEITRKSLILYLEYKRKEQEEAKYYQGVEGFERWIAWLEKQGEQKTIETTWKPSEEQIKILNEILNFAANHESPYWNDYIFGTLNNLIRQLKKLKA